MGKQIRFPALLKKSAGILTLSLALLGMGAPEQASAHNAYYLGITLDGENHVVSSNVGLDNNTVMVDKHSEIEKTHIYFGSTAYDERTYVSISEGQSAENMTITLPSVSWTASPSDISTEYSTVLTKTNAADGDPEYKETLLFSFPGRHVNGVIELGAKKRNGTSSDSEQAYWVSRNLIGGLNKAIDVAYDAGYSGKDIGNGDVVTLTIATNIANIAASGASGSFEVNGAEVTVAPANIAKEDVGAGLEKAAYVTVTADGQSVTVPWYVQKGYANGQRLYTVIQNTTYNTPDFAGEDAKYLTWQHVVMQAGYNTFVNGVVASSITDLNPPSKTERVVAYFLTDIRNTIESLLGLSPMSDLVLNEGTRDFEYWKGIMPKSMTVVADEVHMLTQVLAWLLLSGALAKLFTMRNLAAINPRMRIELKEGLMNIVGASFALIVFIPIYLSMVTLNNALVDYFGGISASSSNFGKIGSFPGGSVGGILLSFVFLFIDVYFNAQYIMRSLQIAVMYAFAPLFIITIAYGGKFKEVFSNFARELTGLIFMQAIHAAILGLYSRALDNGGADGMMYAIIMYASFIPITKMIREKLIGFSSGNPMDQMASIAASTAASGMGALLLSKNGGSHKGEDSKGGVESDSISNQKNKGKSSSAFSSSEDSGGEASFKNTNGGAPTGGGPTEGGGGSGAASSPSEGDKLKEKYQNSGMGKFIKTTTNTVGGAASSVGNAVSNGANKMTTINDEDGLVKAAGKTVVRGTGKAAINTIGQAPQAVKAGAGAVWDKKGELLSGGVTAMSGGEIRASSSRKKSSYRGKSNESPSYAPFEQEDYDLFTSSEEDSITPPKKTKTPSVEEDEGIS